MKTFHLHLISDSTGETVSSVARAAVAQFEDIDPQEHSWTLIRTPAQLEKVLAAIEHEPGMVLYTLINPVLGDKIKQFCHQRGLPCVPVLTRVVMEMRAYFGVETINEPGRQHVLNEDYFSRVEAIDYTLAHDDGQAAWDLEEADIVIVGVSRTSKSPTCIYLANRGYKAANIPYVAEIALPESLFTLKRPLVVGLTIGTERLREIRQTRLKSLQQDGGNTNYVDEEKILAEITASKRLFQKHRWPTIDVTRRSVEETAAQILNLYQKHVEKRLGHGSAHG